MVLAAARSAGFAAEEACHVAQNLPKDHRFVIVMAYIVLAYMVMVYIVMVIPKKHFPKTIGSIESWPM